MLIAATFPEHHVLLSARTTIADRLRTYMMSFADYEKRFVVLLRFVGA